MLVLVSSPSVGVEDAIGALGAWSHQYTMQQKKFFLKANFSECLERAKDIGPLFANFLGGFVILDDTVGATIPLICCNNDGRQMNAITDSHPYNAGTSLVLTFSWDRLEDVKRVLFEQPRLKEGAPYGSPTPTSNFSKREPEALASFQKAQGLFPV